MFEIIMTPEEIRRLETLRRVRQLEQIREIQKLQEVLKTVREVERQQKILKWLEEHRKMLSSMSRSDLEEIREQAEYDEKEWQEILRQLLSDESH